MAAIGRGQSSNCSNPVLDIFTKTGGVEVDVYSAQFQIFEKVTNPGTPVQVYPTTAGERVSLNVTDDCPVGNRLGLGHYVAPYTVPDGEIVGTHEIRWFIRYQSASVEQTHIEEFEVLSSAGVAPDNLYCSVADIRNEGYTDRTDQQVLDAIRLWQQVLERATRQWFYPQSLVFDIDGTDSDSLFFGVPIIQITKLNINNDKTDLVEGTDFAVYTTKTYPYNKGNPRIKLIDTWADRRDIYSAPLRSGRRLFRKGRKNQHIEGVFGYVEPDGSTPLAIRRALTKLTIEKMSRPLVNIGGQSMPPSMSGIVLEEWTDSHRVVYAPLGGTTRPRAPGLSGITSDPEIIDIIKLYRAPIGIASPADPSYR